MTTENDTLKAHAIALKLHGLLSHWDELTPVQTPWLTQLPPCVIVSVASNFLRRGENEC